MTRPGSTGSDEEPDVEISVKSFEELTKAELYALLRLRESVFVVEQNCPYQELDGRDDRAYHVIGREGEEMVAYLRILDRGAEHEEVAIGRVIALRRRQGLGSRILQAGIRAAQEKFGARRIYLEAQTYARAFYERQGFQQISPEFMLDGIPHVAMILEIP